MTPSTPEPERDRPSGPGSDTEPQQGYGQQLEPYGQQPQAPYQQPTYPQQPQYQAAYGQPAMYGHAGYPMMTAPPKNVGIAYLLWFFFGLLGIHKFYLGNIGMGVLWLLTGGLIGFGMLYDLFTLPHQTNQANRRLAAGF